MEAIRRQNPGKVPIHIVEKRAYIWEADDSAFVRREHHICGLLSGTLPLIPQQNVFLGLPLQLFNEEVVYLVRCGAAFLVDDSSAHLIPTSSQAHSFWKQHDSDASSQQIRSLRAQKEASRIFEEKLSSTGSGKSKANSQEDIKVQKAKEALEKRKKREEAKRSKEEEKKRKDGVEELELFGDHQDDDEEDEQILIKNDDNKENSNTSSNNDSVMKEKEDGSLELPNAESIRSKASSRRTQKTEEEEASNLSYSYLTPGSSRNSEWYQPSVDDDPTLSSKVTVYTTLSSASKAGIWNFPSNRRERATCAAFEALHEKGYYMGVGLRFGGDFVVYPGDPLRYHSHFTATVQTSTSSMISTLELIASGRLGTAVKKAHLLCGVSLSQDEPSETDEVEDQRSTTAERIQSGQMDRIEGDQNSGSSWGNVTFYSLTWAGFGT